MLGTIVEMLLVKKDCLKDIDTCGAVIDVFDHACFHRLLIKGSWKAINGFQVLLQMHLSPNWKMKEEKNQETSVQGWGDN